MNDTLVTVSNAVRRGLLSRLKTSAALLSVCGAMTFEGAHAGSTYYNSNDLQDMLYGFSILASGGGGGLGDGQIILNEILSASPGGINIQDASDISNWNTLIVGAGIGSPEALDNNVSGLITAVNAAIDLVGGPNPTSILSVESGPANSFIAALINVTNGYPIYDGDGAGRSVPSLTNTLYDSNYSGISISPVAIAAAPDEPGDEPPASKVWTWIPNADVAEQEIRDEISTNPAYGSVAGLALWQHSGSQNNNNSFVSGTYKLAADIGEVVRDNPYNFDQIVSNLEPIMAAAGRSIYGAELGTITDVSSYTQGGFDIGEVDINFTPPGGNNYTGVIKSENENLLTELTFWDATAGKSKTFLVTAPALISFVIKDPSTNKFIPYNNGDDLEQYEGRQIGVIWSKADNRLYDWGSGLLPSFQTQLGTVGYYGSVCPNLANQGNAWSGCVLNGSNTDNTSSWPITIRDMLNFYPIYNK
ncbi:MAG: DUF917 family protein [Pseudomonadota bacterium]